MTPLSPADADRLMRAATYASVLTAVMLVAVKIAAWLLSGSVAILSSLVDSTADLAASAINLLAVRHALTPADREHRFGHGKAEPLAGLVQAAFIGAAAVFLALEAVDRLIRPQALQHGAVALGVMMVSMALTGALILFQRRVAKATRSIAIEADSKHYLSDFLSNGATVLALVLVTALDWGIADPVLGLFVAGVILWSGIGIARSAYDQLMDAELPNEDRARIREIALKHPEVISIHDLKTRAAGTWRFIQFHLELDGRMTLDAAHAVADRIEAEVGAVFPGAEIIIHQEPVDIMAKPPEAPHAA